MRVVFYYFVLAILIGGFFCVTFETKADEAVIPKVVLATWNWAPYYAENLPNGGAATEIVKASFKRVGYELEVKWVPWTRAIEKAKEGEFDGVLGVWYTEERARSFTYSKPFFKNEIVFFKRKDETINYISPSDIMTYRVGVTRNSGPHEWLKEKYSKNLDLVGSASLNIKKLMAKRFDLLVDEKLGILYILNNEFPEWKNAIESLDPPLQVNELHIMISQKNIYHQKIINDFNRGLREIRQDGTFENILIKHGFDQNSNRDRDSSYRN